MTDRRPPIIDADFKVVQGGAFEVLPVRRQRLPTWKLWARIVLGVGLTLGVMDIVTGGALTSAGHRLLLGW